MNPESNSPAQAPTLSVEYKIKFPTNKRRRKKISPSKKPLRKLPFVTRLLALAYHLQDLIDKGVVSDYADIARLSNLSRSRLTQIMNLMLLAPEIQEELLFLSKEDHSAPSLNEKLLRKITRITGWNEQLELWRKLKT